MGFYPNEQQKTSKLFSEEQATRIITSVVCTGLVFVYFVHVADNTEEYMFAFFALTAAIGVTISHTDLMAKNDKIFKLVDKGENMINDSKFQRLFGINYYQRIHETIK